VVAKRVDTPGGVRGRLGGESGSSASAKFYIGTDQGDDEFNRGGNLVEPMDAEVLADHEADDAVEPPLGFGTAEGAAL